MLRLAFWFVLSFVWTMTTLAGGSHQHHAKPQAEVKTTLSLHHGQGLSLKLRSDGVLFAAWAQGEHIYLQRSANMGKSWSNPLVVNADPLPVRAGGESRVGLALGHADEVFVSFVRKLPQKWTSNLMFTRSTDGGLSFEPVRQINDDQDITSHAFAVMDVAADGTLVIVWIDGRDRLKALKASQEVDGLSLYGVRSRDGGQTFEANQQLVTGTCQCCRLAMTFSPKQEPVVLWRHIFGDNLRDHGLGMWMQDGFQHHRFSHEQWHFMGCPHQGPALITAKKGGYHAAWYTVIDDAPSLFFAHVNAAGKQASTPKRLGSGMHPAMLEHDNQVYMIWLEGTDSGIGLFGQVLTGGEWSEKQLLAKGELGFDHPHLLLKGATLYWGWQVDGRFNLEAWQSDAQNQL